MLWLHYESNAQRSNLFCDNGTRQEHLQVPFHRHGFDLNKKLMTSAITVERLYPAFSVKGDASGKSKIGSTQIISK